MGEFRRQEHEGTGLTSGSFLTEAVQLPQPFDYVTNSFETGIAWAGRKASFRLSYTGSWFQDGQRLTHLRQPLFAHRAGLHGGPTRPPAEQHPSTAQCNRQCPTALGDDPGPMVRPEHP